MPLIVPLYLSLDYALSLTLVELDRERNDGTIDAAERCPAAL